MTLCIEERFLILCLSFFVAQQLQDKNGKDN